MSRYEKGFNATLFECIDLSIRSLFGEASTTALYYGIESKNGMLQADFPKKPGELLIQLEKILGKWGFQYLEKEIRIEIKARFHIQEQDPQSRSLGSLIELAKINFLKSEQGAEGNANPLILTKVSAETA